MAKKNLKSYVDKHTKKTIEADTPFNGSDERYKELEALGLVGDEPTAKELKKAEITALLDQKGIDYKASETKEELLDKLTSEE